MTRFLLAVFLQCSTILISQAQTPVPMSAQAGLTYSEDFTDISNWGDGFSAGIGAIRFLNAPVNATGVIPSGSRISVNSAVFQTTLTSSGIQKGTIQPTSANAIVLLATGTSDNTTSVAFDFFVNFTDVDAGTLSFDWATVFNSTGNRNGSLRIYASDDGNVFTELTTAAVLNITNNVAASGSITNIALPVLFNNKATAQLRFYFYNGSGGTTGSRPKISIDNLKVTAQPNTPCNTPAAQPTGLMFNNITSGSISGIFTAPSPAANEYLVVISSNSSLTYTPVDGTIYSAGDSFGDGYVVSKSNTTGFSTAGLSPLTTYYFYIFSVNSVCLGGPSYLPANPLTGSAATTTALPACSTPVSQPTGLNFSNVTTNAISGNFTASPADQFLVLRSSSATLSASPVNTVNYNPGDIIGNATVVQSNSLTAFTAGGLSFNSLYYFYIFSANNPNCNNGPVYFTSTPLKTSQSTANLSACVAPSGQPTSLNFSTSSTSISGNFKTGQNADSYIVLRSTSPSLSANPVNNTSYNPDDIIGNAIVVSTSSNTSFISRGLTPNTSYYYFSFASNKGCSGGIKYLLTSPLAGNATTTNQPLNDYFFGNIHAHSDYSDGNKDNIGFTPYDNYQYAMVSQCMDFLGISEHNHYTSNNNPGNKLSNYRLGSAQANSFNASNTGFTALYGMEWGVISNGGHVLVYGNGMDELWGWETGSGGWGTTNNYDVLIDKYNYKGTNGLFQTINSKSNFNTFATLAHPDLKDYDSLSYRPYNAQADSAIAGVAVESGPAFSTNTTYGDPASSLSYLSYYQKLLSKGYHVAPTIDHDNHYTTFGRTARTRTAVVAPVNTKTEIIKAYRSRQFYATYDCDTKVEFLVNTRVMGSIVTDQGAPVISVFITDATTSTSGAVIRLMYGRPGSNTLPVKLDSATGNKMIYVDNNLANLATGYYYADIRNGSSRIITAPVWYSRQDISVLPVSLNSFTVQKIDKSAKLTWRTAQEINSQYFIIERSGDGIHWNSIITQPAAGFSQQMREYTAFDNVPFDGINYYRIKGVDKDNYTQVSEIKSVSFTVDFSISLTPNPASDKVTVSVNSAEAGGSTIQLWDATGKLYFSKYSNQSTMGIDISSFARGVYFIKVLKQDKTATLKLLIK